MMLQGTNWNGLWTKPISICDIKPKTKWFQGNFGILKHFCFFILNFVLYFFWLIFNFLFLIYVTLLMMAGGEFNTILSVWLAFQHAKFPFNFRLFWYYLNKTFIVTASRQTYIITRTHSKWLNVCWGFPLCACVLQFLRNASPEFSKEICGNGMFCVILHKIDFNNYISETKSNQLRLYFPHKLTRYSTSKCKFIPT